MRAAVVLRGSLRSPIVWLVLVPLAAVALLSWYLPAGGGIDTAAHAYKIAVARSGGSWLWDGFWYSGSYAAGTYGFLYYLVASYTGESVLVVSAAGLLPILFWHYLGGVWGLSGTTRLLPPIGLAVTVLLALPFGEHPYLVGLALAMAGAALLGVRRASLILLGGSLVGASLFVNPLATLCIAVFLCADLIGRPAVRRRLAAFGVALAPFVALRLAMLVVFAQPSVELDLLASQAKFVALGLGGALVVRLSRDPDRRAKSLVFLVAACACALAWLVPHNPVGDDMGRFFMIFGLPVLLAVRLLWAPLRVAALLLCAVLVLPLSMAVAAAGGPGPNYAAWQAFFAPGLRLAGRLYGPNYRFEVVPLAKHWDAYFFPLAGYPLAQGWYRQGDAIHNLALRDGATESASQYAAWLRIVGVKYVFYGHAALAPDAAGIPGLLSDSAQFQKVASAGRWTVYRVRRPQPLVTTIAGHRTSSAKITDYLRTQLTIHIRRAGDYILKTTWSPYWTLSGGRGTLSRAGGDWLELHARATGVYELRFGPSIGGVIAQLF
jgi:hypothetical protein